MEPNAPRTVNNVEVICIASPEIISREASTHLHSALTGWQATVFYRAPSTKEEKTRLGRWASTLSIIQVIARMSNKFATSSFRIHVPDLTQLSIREAKYKHAWRRYFSIQHNGFAVLDFSYYFVSPLADIPCNVIFAKAFSPVKAIIRFFYILAAVQNYNELLWLNCIFTPKNAAARRTIPPDNKHRPRRFSRERPGAAVLHKIFYLPSISFRASLRLKLARPFSSKPMNLTQVMSPRFSTSSTFSTRRFSSLEM